MLSFFPSYSLVYGQLMVHTTALATQKERFLSPLALTTLINFSLIVVNDLLNADIMMMLLVC